VVILCPDLGGPGHNGGIFRSGPLRRLSRHEEAPATGEPRGASK
jgi:hypothetical protein